MDKKDINQLRLIPIYTTLIKLGLIQDKNDKQQFKNENMRISFDEMKWYDHKNGKGSSGSIDLVMHVLSCDFLSACKFLGNSTQNEPHQPKTKTDSKETHTPTPNVKNIGKAVDYLLKRGIDKRIINYCIDRGLLFADDFSNAVFLYGLGCEIRGTGKSYKRCYGRLTEPFIIPAPKPEKIVLCESAIDAMSYRTLNNGVLVASVAGVNRIKVIQRVIDLSAQLDLTLICGFDNDSAGDKAYLAIKEIVPDCIRVKPLAKDWNEDLKKINSKTYINEQV